MSQRGFTLIETLVGIFLSGVTLLVTFVLAFEFYRSYTEIQNKLDVEKSLTMAISQLQRQLSLAVNVSAVTTSLNSVNIGLSDTGKIRDYTAGTTMGSVPGAIDTIALFVRERGGHQTPPMSEYGPVAIFYARPTPRTTGTLFINVDSTTTSKTPSYSDIFFSNIVSFTLTNFQYNPVGAGTSMLQLTSVEASITMRKFLSADTTTWNFCPPADISAATSGCTGIRSYNDISRTLRIALSNQIVATTSPRNMDPTTSPFERVFGNLYLFPSK